jgi:hypothetical protein
MKTINVIGVVIWQDIPARCLRSCARQIAIIWFDDEHLILAFGATRPRLRAGEKHANTARVVILFAITRCALSNSRMRILCCGAKASAEADVAALVATAVLNDNNDPLAVAIDPVVVAAGCWRKRHIREIPPILIGVIIRIEPRLSDVEVPLRWRVLEIMIDIGLPYSVVKAWTLRLAYADDCVFRATQSLIADDPFLAVAGRECIVDSSEGVIFGVLVVLFLPVGTGIAMDEVEVDCAGIIRCGIECQCPGAGCVINGACVEFAGGVVSNGTISIVACGVPHSRYCVADLEST